MRAVGCEHTGGRRSALFLEEGGTENQRGHCQRVQDGVPALALPVLETVLSHLLSFWGQLTLGPLLLLQSL